MAAVASVRGMERQDQSIYIYELVVANSLAQQQQQFVHKCGKITFHLPQQCAIVNLFHVLRVIHFTVFYNSLLLFFGITTTASTEIH
jgi:hypothetical protein